MRKRKISTVHLIYFCLFVGIFETVLNTSIDHILIPLLPKYNEKFHLDVLIAGLSGGLGAFIGLKLFPVKQNGY